MGAIRRMCMFFLPRYSLEGLEHIPATPCVFIANHARAYGPALMMTQLQRHIRPWVHWRVCTPAEFPAYAMEDFWRDKPARSLWFYRLLSRALRRVGPYIFGGVRAIPVYHDLRVIGTLRQSARALQGGEDIVIFPETDAAYNQYINRLQSGFVDIGKLCGDAPLSFIPVYVCPSLRKIVCGKAAIYAQSQTVEENRARICAGIQAEITALARALPPHTVVTYRKK